MLEQYSCAQNTHQSIESQLMENGGIWNIYRFINVVDVVVDKTKKIFIHSKPFNNTTKISFIPFLEQEIIYTH